MGRRLLVAISLLLMFSFQGWAQALKTNTTDMVHRELSNLNESQEGRPEACCRLADCFKRCKRAGVVEADARTFHIKTFNGLAQILIQSKTKSGTVQLKVKVENLQESFLELNVAQ